jgi:hypothetical protein
MSEEQWKVIPGYEGYYEISDQGRVRSIERDIKSSYKKVHKRKSIIKQTFVTKNNRAIVLLSKEAVNKTYQISRLIALAFLPNSEALPEVDHIDRNSLNNNLTNLRWCDRKTNLKNRNDFERPLGITGHRGIVITAQGHYQVSKLNEDGTHISCGTRKTLEEAIALRDSGKIDCVKTLGKSGERYITKTRTGAFCVRKTTNNNEVCYGTFPTLEEAIVVRNTIPGYKE